MKPAITAVRHVYRGWMNLLLVTLRMPDNRMAERHVMENSHAVGVLPYDPERRTVLVVSMPRAPVLYMREPEMIEAIAGALDGDLPETCARREALEEAGVRISQLEHIGQVWTMPSNSTERIDLFLAPYRKCDRIAEGGGLEDEQEHISVYELPIVELWGMFKSKKVYDSKIIMLLQALKINHPELFV